MGNNYARNSKKGDGFSFKQYHAGVEARRTEGMFKSVLIFSPFTHPSYAAGYREADKALNLFGRILPKNLQTDSVLRQLVF